MFRQRTSSQKPGDDLLANFRQQFPQIVAVSTDAPVPAMSSTTTTTTAHPAAINAPSQRQDSGPSVENEPFRDQDPTPRASHEPWRFTPSLLDPNSFAFHSFANASHGYYTPTPGGNTLFHSQAGDLHTPAMPVPPGLGTPMSMPTSADAIHPPVTVVDMTGFHGVHPHSFQHFGAFIQSPPPQPGYSHPAFVPADTGYETMEQEGSPMGSDPSDGRMTSIATTLHPPKLAGTPVGRPLPSSAEKFRFHSTLNAPTAMIKHADEVPVTYLNKGQAYSLSVADTSGTLPMQPGTRYRTFVRISFEDDEQRQKPGVCWSLWKEGRGMTESHRRGGKLQAVEFVEAGQPAESDDKRTRVELESSSFDGFSVIWTPGINGAPEVNVAVRFNFLSTDFSHSKGVKGIPVRLCAKTSPFGPDASHPAADTMPEICFCKVKLFRDHGAERKLSNDVAHVKKSIDKVKQQLTQVESGVKDFGKRKRHSNSAKAADPQHAGKVPKHKRTWSMSSASSAGGGGGRTTMEEDLHVKLQTLQDMFTSTRPVSVLYLRGEELDDPDLHPVSLPGDMSPPGKTDGPRDGPSNWRARSAQSSATGSMVSPSPSSLSLASQASAMGSGVVWQNVDATAPGDAAPRKGPEQASRIAKTDDDGNLSGWIEALGVDASYRPPPERGDKAVACFYVVHHQARTGPEKQAYYRAIYLMKRTLEELKGRIASKWGLDASRIQRTVRVLPNGIEVEMDDEVVRELKEGQDMRLDMEEVAKRTRCDWEMLVDGRGDETGRESGGTAGVVVRLSF